MITARRYKPTDVRSGMIAKIKIGQKQLGWDNDIYRDVLDVRYGVSSSTQLTITQLEDLIAHMKAHGFKPTKKAPARAGTRKLAEGPEIEKMRALWISLYQLGVVRDPAEQALVNFAKRVSGGKATGKAALQWLDGEEAVKVIEALKAMAVRDGGVNWEPYSIGGGPCHAPRCRVIEAQWRALMDLGEVSDIFAMNGYACAVVGIVSKNTILNFGDAQLDRVIEALGACIRKALAARGHTTLKAWREAQVK